MNGCEKYEALLDLFADGELPPEEMDRVNAHLNSCPACRNYVDGVLAVRAAFPDLEDVEVPPGFAESVMERIRSESPARPPSRRMWRTGMAAALAACFAVVLLMRTLPAGYGGMDNMAKTESVQDSTPAECGSSGGAEEETAAADGISGEENGIPYYNTDGGADSSESTPSPRAGLRSAVPAEENAADAQDDGGLPEAVVDLAETPEAVQHSAAQTPAPAMAPAGGAEADSSDMETASESPAVTDAAPAFKQNPALVLSQTEAGNLLESFAPVEDSGAERVYLLSKEEFSDLLEKLPAEYGGFQAEALGELVTVIVTAA